MPAAHAGVLTTTMRITDPYGYKIGFQEFQTTDVNTDRFYRRAYGGSWWPWKEYVPYTPPAPSPFVFARKTVQTQTSNSTTYVIDNELFLDLSVGLWRISADLIVTGTEAVADVQLKWVTANGLLLTGGAGRLCIGPATTATATGDSGARHTSHGFGTSVSYGVVALNGTAILETLLLDVNTAGRLQLHWSQNTAVSGSPVSMALGSRIIGQKVG
jgi:hypothetical protein